MSRQVTYSSLLMTSNPSFGSEFDDDKENREDGDSDLQEEEDETTCGWFGFRPGCIQRCNRSACFLVFWSAFALFQSTTVNGLVYVAITTLEKRFSLPSAQSGAISSSFDFTVLSLILFVTYLTERYHKPLLLGFGAIVFGLGSYVFTLPHFLSPKYSTSNLKEHEICHLNGTAEKCEAESNGSLSDFYWYFIAGQVLHGIGACPIYTHGRTFIYENVRTNIVPVYFAIFQLLSSLGIAVGYVLGGILLQLYTDLRVDVNTLDINPDSPLWIGNWWIGFFIFGSCSLLVSIPLTSFPKALRGTSAIRKANDAQTRPQKGSEFYSTRGLSGLLKDFPRAMWNLIKNVPLMCINFGVAAEFAVITSTTVFGPKFVETQFNLQPGTAAFSVGAILVPASTVGVLLGGWIIKKFDLKYTGQARFCLLALLGSISLLTAFFMGCPNVDLAGVTTTYTSNHSAFDDSEVINITESCNSRCQCEDSYSPVCGTNDVMYYSACHAGCSSSESVNGTKMYVGCSCIPGTYSDGLEGGGGGVAIPGRCTTDCNKIYFFFLLVFCLVVCSSLMLVPSQTMLLGVVSPSQRTTAMGLHSLIFRAFGSVPSPIIFGRIIDSVCLIWEYDCHGAKTCWMYQNEKLSVSAFLILGSCRSLSLLFFTAALFSYKPTESSPDGKVEN